MIHKYPSFIQHPHHSFIQHPIVYPSGEILFCNTERIPEFKRAVLDLVTVERNEAAASVAALEEIMEALTSDTSTEPRKYDHMAFQVRQ